MLLWTVGRGTLWRGRHTAVAIVGAVAVVVVRLDEIGCWVRWAGVVRRHRGRRQQLLPPALLLLRGVAVRRSGVGGGGGGGGRGGGGGWAN